MNETLHACYGKTQRIPQILPTMVITVAGVAKMFVGDIVKEGFVYELYG